MKIRHAYIWTIIFAALGMALSGFLTYRYYWGPGCLPSTTFLSCGGVTIFNRPTCVYGFAFFTISMIVALMGVGRQSVKNMKALIWLGLAGVLFSGGLTIDEYLIGETVSGTITACVYGLVFFLGIFVSAIFGSRNRPAQLELPR